jgi:phosphoribosylaminoimidazole-succinocarboxamide synthase
MITEDRIRRELGNVLEETDFTGLGRRIGGKVRDSYVQDNRRILVATDRVSAFDCILGTIPFKGQVLTQLAAFWFRQTAAIAPNHLLDVPDPNIMVVAECDQLPIEFVVRGYITGVTKTSAWYNYERGVRNLCGNPLPDGLRKDQRFERPILTPTTKHEAHDRNLSRDEAIAEGLIDAATFDAAASLCFRLFDAGVRHAASRGLILVDTKYEIGRRDGRLTVSDEIHTPDSSRYWYADTYESRFARGEDQRKLDKEYVREWLAARGFRGDGTPPALTDEVRVEAARRYILACEEITGLPFEPATGPIRERVRQSLERLAAARPGKAGRRAS